MRIITISGKSEAGKDFSGIILKEKLVDKKILILHYADYLKYIAKQYFGWDGVKDEKGRQLLQKLGTNVIRERNSNFWVEIILLLIKTLGDDFDYYIIPDCRFPNEIELMKYYFEDTISLKVVRLNHTNSMTIEQRNHLSEISLDNYDFDYVIYSKSGKENLSKELDEFIKKFNL